jgi:hypothetical protein
MQVLNMLSALLVAMAVSPFGPWAAVAAVATVVTFFVTAAGRNAIDAALHAHGGQPLALFDLSHGDTAKALKDKIAVAPERLWTYDEEYLDHFVQKTKAVTVWQRPALEVYCKFVLRWDIAFAVSMTAFIVLFWLDVATASWAPPWLARLAILAECMGVLYGFADVPEDIKLLAILRDPQRIDPAETAAANALTRVKLVAVMLSVVGALLFAVLSAANKLSAGLSGPVAGTVPPPRPPPGRGAARSQNNGQKALG